MTVMCNLNSLVITRISEDAPRKAESAASADASYHDKSD
jgi:hypothetical protein